MGSYAVYHTSKGKGNGGGLGNHIDRVEGMEHTYQNVATENHENENVNYPLLGGFDKMELSKAIKTNLKQNYNGKRKIRGDQVLYLTHIFSGSHKAMKKLEENKEQLDKWVQANYEFACEEFGEKNIVRFTLHRDEKTPHLHVVTVPITEDGRLSAKERVGNKIDLRNRQTKYAKQMEQFGLERGKASGIEVKHETTSEYRKRIANTENNLFKADISPVKGLFGTDKSKTITKHEEALIQSEKVVQQEIARADDAENKYNTVFKRANKDLSKEKEKNKRLEEENRKLSVKVFKSNELLKKEVKEHKIANSTLKSINDKYENIDVQNELNNQKKLGNKNKGLSM